MPLTAEDITAVRQVVKEEVGKVYALLARGDDPVPAAGQTHPWNLKAARLDVAQVDAAVKALAGGPALSDAQLETLAERLAPLVAARVQIAGLPTYTTGTPVEFHPVEPDP